MYSVVNGETKSVCLTRSVIRILSDDYYFYLIERTKVESIEDQFSRREDLILAIFAFDEIGQCAKVVFVEFGF